jgi:diguanylate cyclase (GGDEF)-like protein/PAS domain S-box-containing protein
MGVMKEVGILLFEDEAAGAAELAAELKGAGFSVAGIASSLEEAIALGRAADPILVVMDVRLKGGLDGIEAARQIQREVKLPVVFVTADADAATRARARDLVPFGYVVKPFAPEELRRTLEIAVDRAQITKEFGGREEQFRLMVEQIPAVLWTTDLELRFTSSSGAGLAALGLRQNQVVGLTLTEFFGSPGENFPAIAATRRALDGESVSYEAQWQDRHYQCYTRPMRESLGRTIGSIGVALDITDRVKAEEQLLQDATHDRLTGLSNRSNFVNHLSRALETGRRSVHRLAVLLVDLDRFKLVNDSLGHAAGDRLLIEAGRVLTSLVRPTDLVARIGGDEFAILLDDLEGEGSATMAAARLQHALRQPFSIGGRDVFSTASIGIAFSRDGAEDPEELLRDADTAMFRAKERGRARHEVFDKSMHSRAVALLDLETDLRHALERHEFRLHYQPINRLRSGEITGFEALLRWSHPERGLLTPEHFLPFAEDAGLIGEIDAWVLHRACRQIGEWRKRRPGGEIVPINVNLSNRQFLEAGLPDRVEWLLAEANVPAGSLRLEVTEGVLIADLDAAAETLHRLKRAGISVCLDDFGTGYSSLSYLFRFPVDWLKIDRSFISGLKDAGASQEIVQAILVLAQNLGMSVVAEGVETHDQRSRLTDLGCSFGQGFLFSPAVESPRAWEMLEAGSLPGS